MGQITDIPHRAVNAKAVSSNTTITIYEAGTSTLVSLFSDEALTVPIANPFTVTSGNPIPILYYSYPGEVRVKAADAGGTLFDDSPYGAPVGELELAYSDGGRMVGFRQDDPNAVDRTILAKAREVVSLDDFLLLSGGNPREALERASAFADVVNIFGGTYELDQTANIAADTIIIGHGCVIKPAAGYADPNLMTFLGNGSLEGTGYFVGSGMPSPTTTWAGVGIPVGSAVHIAGLGDLTQRRYALKVKGWTFSGFPGGLIYAKWVLKLEVEGCTFFDNQKASVQWKASGNYANITTTNAGTSTVPIGELITDHGIQVYQSTEAIVTRISMVDIRSKGISLNVDFATLQSNVMKGASPRHCMEHLTGCTSAVSTGNSYDGGPDMGDAVKPVNCTTATLGGGSIRNSSIGYYIQDCGNVTLIPISMLNVSNAYWPAHSNIATGWMYISGQVGEVVGDSGTQGSTGKFLSISSDAAAVSAGYGMKINLSGGHVSNFTYGMFHATSGLGMILDIALVGGIHFQGLTTGGLDLRARNINIDAVFSSCLNSLMIGSTRNSTAGTVTASKSISVRARMNGCIGTHCRIGAQAVYDLIADMVNIDLEGDGGTRVVSFGLGANDSLKLFTQRVRGYGQSTIGSAVYVDAGSKALKGIFDIALVDGSAGPNNITFANAASLTGPFLTRICGISGAHGMTL